MKIFADDQLIFEISELHLIALLDSTRPEDLGKNLRENIRWFISSHCQQQIDRIKKDWLPVLFKRYKSIPTSDEELIKLIISQPDYLNYSGRKAKEHQLKGEKEATYKEI